MLRMNLLPSLFLLHARWPQRLGLLTLLAGLSGCANVQTGAGVNIGVPILPGVSLGVNVGTGGISAGVNAHSGPVGVGVGVADSTSGVDDACCVESTSGVDVSRGPVVTSDARHGDSIAVNGVCLTVLEATADGRFSADVMAETLNRSSLRALAAGSLVNLERAAALNSR